MKLLTGMLAPSEGSCRILGFHPTWEPQKVHACSGVVTEHAQMYDHMTGMQNLQFYASVFGLSRQQANQRAEALLEQLELKDAGNQKLSTYSTGMRQRLSLARALIHKPRVLFLDEPTSGLDPESVQKVNGLIQNLAKEEGVTVFLCTHQLRYAQEICTRYGLMEQGKLLAVGTLDELQKRVCPGMILQICAADMPKQLPFLSKGEGIYETRIESEKEIPELIRSIVAGGGDIYEVIAKKPSLEEVYFTLTAQEGAL